MAKSLRELIAERDDAESAYNDAKRAVADSIWTIVGIIFDCRNIDWISNIYVENGSVHFTGGYSCRGSINDKGYSFPEFILTDKDPEAVARAHKKALDQEASAYRCAEAAAQIAHLQAQIAKDSQP